MFVPKLRLPSFFVTALVSLPMLVPIAAADIIYVRSDKITLGNGTNWFQALRDLQTAIDIAQPGDEIWVKAGTHYPDVGNNQTNNDRSSTFTLKNGVSIYGGFDGVSTNFADRDPATNVTILSGEIDGTPADTSGNAYNVVTGSGTNSTAILDGFTITAGNGEGGTFPDNVGAGLVCEPNGSPTIRNCIFDDNHSPNLGGGIYIAWDPGKGSPSFTDCVFSNNSARSGGAAFNQTPDATFLRCTFSGNNTENDGAAVYNQDSTSFFTDCDFEDNVAGRQAGAIFNEDSDLTFTGCDFRRNTAPFNGGAVFNSTATVSFTHCIFEDNTAPGEDDGSGTLTGGDGGAVYDGGSSTTYTGCSFLSNSAQQNGGACRAAVRDSIASSPSFDDCTFTGNSATFSGALDLFATASVPATLTITGGTFTSNTSDGSGGAINASNTTVGITGASFVLNTAVDNGGAIQVGSGAEVTIEDSSFTNNTAKAGGAANLRSDRVAVTGSTFTGNEATGTNSGGGALSISSEFPSVEGCDFDSNLSGFAGGALNLDSTGADVPQVIKCRFRGNSAPAYGGACNFTLFGGTAPFVSGCLFTGNSTTGRGSAARFSDGMPVIESCTATGNSADEGTFSIESAAATLRDTIIYNNIGYPGTTTTPSASLRFSNGSASYIHCLIDNFTKATLDAGAPANGNLEPVDPQFVSPTDPAAAPTLAGNAALGGGSPVIDAGSVSAITTDLDLAGNPRIVNWIIDLGALEYQGPDPFEEDADGDGTDGGVELAIGTDPGVPDAGDPRNLRILPGATPQFTFGYDASTAAEITLELRRSTDLANFDVVVSSSDLGFPAPGGGGLITITDPSPPAGRAFYRLVAVPK
ncbi:choice-of-anchor Q domain-containing protein [Haloferula sp. A504]|uniref:choice-of-anchor Q domain-containing protein n=1 Tax=Haloferula sp. A504 TaxID=3373601 RepID=UPI0031C12CD7|nr:hypothetical protein [Verrucomicrobiaceae bacterium E54]